MKSRRRNILILALSQGFAVSSAVVLVTESSLVGLALASRPAYATMPVAVQAIATLLTTFPAAALMQRRGRRFGFTVGTLIGALGAALGAVAIIRGSFSLFCAATALLGSANGFSTFYRFAAAEAVDEERRGAAISWVLTGGLAAAFLGPLLARHSKHLIPGALYAGSFAAIAAVSLLAIAALRFLSLPPAPAPATGQHGRSFGAIARQPLFVSAVCAASVSYGVMAFVMTGTPLAMASCHHGFQETAHVIQWHVVAMFAPSFVTGKLVGRFGPGVVVAAGLALLAGSSLAGLSGDSVGSFSLSLVLLGLGWNLSYVGATALLTKTYAPNERAKVQALNDVIVFSLVAAGGVGAGAVQSAAGWRGVNVVAILVVALAAAVMVWAQVESAKQTRAAPAKQ